MASTRLPADLVCSVCLAVMDEPMITRCGHTFCHRCVTATLGGGGASSGGGGRCPQCARALDSVDSVFPNLLASQLVARYTGLGGGGGHRVAVSQTAADRGLCQQQQQQQLQLLEQLAGRLPLDSVCQLLRVLQRRRVALETQSQRVQCSLVREFLSALRRRCTERVALAQSQLRVVERDLALLQRTGDLASETATTAAETAKHSANHTSTTAANSNSAPPPTLHSTLLSTLPSALSNAALPAAVLDRDVDMMPLVSDTAPVTLPPDSAVSAGPAQQLQLLPTAVHCSTPNELLSIAATVGVAKTAATTTTAAAASSTTHSVAGIFGSSNYSDTLAAAAAAATTTTTSDIQQKQRQLLPPIQQREEHGVSVQQQQQQSLTNDGELSVSCQLEHRQRVRRMLAHFDDLAVSYFSTRQLLHDQTVPAAAVPGSDSDSAQSQSGSAGDDASDATQLRQFGRTVCCVTRYSRWRQLATLQYAGSFDTNTIVSSIEFDKCCHLFAIAGVTRLIKLYDYHSVVDGAGAEAEAETAGSPEQQEEDYEDGSAGAGVRVSGAAAGLAAGGRVDQHYPVDQLACAAKISCLSWHCYHRALLASSDYSGVVSVWDTSCAQRLHAYCEHEKRCWSVDFNRVDAGLLASASEDYTVRLWATNGAPRSVLTLNAGVNVCCVKFNPASRHHLAFGATDHCVHYYDLRHVRRPLRVYAGHRRAVSYVNFLDGQQLASASTDSQLRLWNTGQTACVATLTGHVNEKNFVGLATDGSYLACGSEDNAVYVYYRGVTRPVSSYTFEPAPPLLAHEAAGVDTGGATRGAVAGGGGGGGFESGGQFVSAVCWKQDSDVLLAANSQGIVKVLELC